MVSSGGALTERLHTEDVDGSGGAAADGAAQYARDKRRQIAMAEHLARDWAPAGVFCCSMHPGWTETEGVKTSLPAFYNAFKARLRTLAQGADTVTYLSCQDVAKLEPGAFYLDRQPQAKHLPLAGTKYSQEDVGRLVKALDTAAEPALRAA
jgi:dehydrogenase/reductase SDR family protein 12